ncbi:MAG TPA: transketolase C-terminal domain-containing protein [Candidatus Woesebacteria bacterium]|nr:transketolase C-terminal domain-containing protein [Candidatus Woesebacteria bacterium]
MKKPEKNLNQSMRKAFGETILKLATINKNLYVVSMDLKSSLSLEEFADVFPDRFIECGLAEANAAGVAAGLAKAGKIVFLCSFACFSPAINWAQIRQSICENNCPVKIIGSHAGLLSGNLGASHQMLEDVALMRVLPHMEVFAPLDANEVRSLIPVVYQSPSPAYIRLVRPETPVYSSQPFTIGKSNVLQMGNQITIVGYGPILFQAFNFKEAEIINCSSLKPLDEETILKSVRKTKKIIVLEDHQQNGGLGEAIAILILKAGIKCNFRHLAVHDRFGQSGNPEELYNFYGLHLDRL